MTRVHGSARVEGVTVRNLSDGHEEYIACDTLIVCRPHPGAGAGGTGRRRRALPDWLYLCGNACYVHDLVDDVTYEGEAIGRAAADFVRTGRKGRACYYERHPYC